MLERVDIELEFEKPIDFLTYQLKQQYYNLSENELKMLAILYLKGVDIEVKKQIVKLGIFKSIQTVDNHLSKFKDMGIIQGKDKKVCLKKDLIKTKEGIICVKIKLR